MPNIFINVDLNLTLQDSKNNNNFNENYKPEDDQPVSQRERTHSIIPTEQINELNY